MKKIILSFFLISVIGFGGSLPTTKDEAISTAHQLIMDDGESDMVVNNNVLFSMFGIQEPVKTSASKNEIEIGNMFQSSYAKWRKANNNSNKPSFITQENIMRAGGCSISYHRCYYKGMYYKFEYLATTRYPKIDISRISKPTKKKRKKKSSKSTVVKGPDAVYSKKDTSSSTNNSQRSSVSGTGSYGKNLPNLNQGFGNTPVPNFPGSNKEAYSPKVLPKI